MKCMVVFCKNSGKIPGVTYFSLTPNRHDAWMRALGRDPTIEHLSASNRICSDHFLEGDKFMEKNKWKLKSGVVPKLKLTIRPLMPIQEIIRRKSSSYDLPSTSGQQMVKECTEDVMRETSSDQQEGLIYEDKENLITSVIYDPINELSQEGSSSSSTASPATASPVNSAAASPRISLLKRKAVNNSSSSDSEGNKGQIKRARRDVKQFHNYNTSSQRILMKLRKTQDKKIMTYKKFRVCRRRVQRLSKKVSSLKQVLGELKKKKLLSDDALDVLEKSYSGIPLTLMRRAIFNINKQMNGKKQGRNKIPEEIRSFAMTLQFYSSKAYNYVRKTFNLALPAPSTIRS